MIDTTQSAASLVEVQNHLKRYRHLKGNKYHESDESKQLHDAIQFLAAAVDSLVSQLDTQNQG
ncbi:hypothetical protein ICM05_01140 [Leucobacter sp. cx-42]|uniref:hypothetical protein n=1 Tax=unclassified Leucobacter TaxID=2621730 RepID=UPI00165D7894|nr:MULTISPECIES: hypothetical protein [unclassified Leucobacter]MBC9953253.1 hypothetical protein [Leucobacter sp. cx-42]